MENKNLNNTQNFNATETQPIDALDATQAQEYAADAPTMLLDGTGGAEGTTDTHNTTAGSNTAIDAQYDPAGTLSGTADDTATAPWYKSRKALIALIAALIIIAAIIACIAIASNQPESIESTPTPETTQASTSTADAITEVNVPVNLPEWNTDATCALVAVDDGKTTTYTAVQPDKPKTTLKLKSGTYKLSLVSPINKDGSIYVTADAQTITIDKAQSGTLNKPVVGTKLAPENVTDDQINAIKDAFNKAKDTGAVDSKVIDKVTTNANAGADARHSKTDEEKQSAQETAKQDAQKDQQTTTDKANTGSSTGTTTTVSTPATDTGSSTSTDTGATSGQTSTQEPSTPAHEHSWYPVYTTVHHDAVTTQEPIYKTVEVNICSTCGQEITGSPADHVEAHMLAGEPWSGHYGSTKTEIVGYETVVVQDAYDEQVLDHYACSCGATQ